MAIDIFVLMILLTVGFLGTRVASILRIPHSVFLVMAGVAAGIVARQSSNAHAALMVQHFPEIILYLLLPPLIFEAAYELDFELFQKDIAPISALAVAGMTASTVLVGFFLHWIFGLPLAATLTFGALISATDPVAVVALFKEVGAPRRLSTLVEGESLLNDGTAIVLFRLLLIATLGGNFSFSILGWGAAHFVLTVFGGVAIGWIIGWITNLLLKFTAPSVPAQLGLTVASAYISFLAAEHFFGVSGVIATMTVGLYLSKRNASQMNGEARAAMHQMWQMLALTANVVVFFAVGLIIDPQSLHQAIRFIPLTLLVVYVARAISVAGTLPIVEKLRLGRHVSLAYQGVLIWGGLRGGLALGLALTLPLAFPHRHLFIALSASVVFATLFLNAVTTKKVLKMLKLI